MRCLALIVLLAACQERPGPAGSGSAAVAGSGSAAVGSGVAVVRAGSTAVPDAAPSSCDVNGNYRLRFRTNGADGWWMRLRVANNQAVSVTDADMLGMQGAKLITVVDPKACAITVTASATRHGDIKLALVVADDKVAGTLARTDEYEDKISAISGLRETGPQQTPKCVRLGVYEISVEHVKKWKTDGDPRAGSCKSFADINKAYVRVDRLGNEMVIYEVQREAPYDQRFGRADVRIRNECQITMGLEVEDFMLHDAELEFNGDKVTGTTTDFTYQVMEDGDAGENMWRCHAKQGDVVWRRIAD